MWCLGNIATFPTMETTCVADSTRNRVRVALCRARSSSVGPEGVEIVDYH